MPTAAELTPREGMLRRIIDAFSRDRKAGRPVALSGVQLLPPETPLEHVYQATINDVLERGSDSPFSGASDDFVSSS